MLKKKSLVAVPFIFSFLVILAVSLYANSLISFSMRTMEYNIEHRLIAESKRLAGMVNAEELDKYRAVRDMELPEYQALRQRLLDFSLEADVLYAYYIRPEKDAMQYIVDNDYDEETRVGLDTPPFDPCPTPWILSALEERLAVCSGLGNYTPGWDGLLSGYAPVFDRDGNVIAIAGVDIEDEPIVRARRLVSILTAVQIIAVAAIFASGIVYLIYLYRQMEIAREANLAKSGFLSQMSHEIRTPNAIIGMAELLLQGELSNEACGHADSKSYYDNTGAGSAMRYTFPGARLLVVDDIATNLKVTEGLLAPCLVTVDTCLNGLQAIEMVKKRDYDIILMDHLMPEMDGIETVAVIRSLEGERFRNVPIVALTANAVVGMREMFIEKGFNDFLSKPIDVSKLDEMLARWIPKGKREQGMGNGEQKIGNGGQEIGNGEWGIGSEVRGQSELPIRSDYKQQPQSPVPTPYSPLFVNSPFLTALSSRLLDKLEHYRAAFEMSRTSSGLEIDTEYYRRFVSLVESFDTLPNFLESDRALLIEAGRNEDAQKIRERLPAFCENIAAMHQREAENEGTENEMVGLILQRLKRAILDGESNTAGKILTELGAKSLTPIERDLYFKLYDSLMDDNTEKALGLLERHLVG